MAGGLGKGLKGGSNALFKRTEVSEEPQMHITSSAPVGESTRAPLRQSEDVSMQQIPEPVLPKTVFAPLQEIANAHVGKTAEVRKHIVLPEPLAERLRRFCFEQRAKEAPVVREALDQFLTRLGY